MKIRIGNRGERFFIGAGLTLSILGTYGFYKIMTDDKALFWHWMPFVAAVFLVVRAFLFEYVSDELLTPTEMRAFIETGVRTERKKASGWRFQKIKINEALEDTLLSASSVFGVCAWMIFAILLVSCGSLYASGSDNLPSRLLTSMAVFAAALWPGIKVVLKIFFDSSPEDAGKMAGKDSVYFGILKQKLQGGKENGNNREA